LRVRSDRELVYVIWIRFVCLQNVEEGVRKKMADTSVRASEIESLKARNEEQLQEKLSYFVDRQPLSHRVIHTPAQSCSHAQGREGAGGQNEDLAKAARSKAQERGPSAYDL
jgi:hypothetical protein